MEASATADDPYFPIYISSDEDDSVAVLGASYSPEEIQIQQAILLSVDSSRAPTTTPSSSAASPSGTAVAGAFEESTEESPPDRKGKRKLLSEVLKLSVASRGSLFKPELHQVIDVDDVSLNQVIDVDDNGLNQVIDLDDDSLIYIGEMDKGRKKKPRYDALQELGQCSRGATTSDEFYCIICMETVPAIERFPIAGCAHAFCVSCVRQYIAAKVEENMLAIGCPDPGCKNGMLHPEECRYVIPPELFQRWGAALCDMALGEIKFYCPFKDCSALLVDDRGEGDAAITNVECPHCSRVFCAQCKVPWHDGVACAEFQRLGEDERGREDLLLRKVAQESKWQRCPKCKIYVERVQGCSFIRCRCGHCFCYLCGSTMARENHLCMNCKRIR